MPYQKGESGNRNGRPKQTSEQKEQSARFRALIKQATIPALESVIEIAGDRRHKDRLSACRFIIEKAYGANAVFAADDEPITINIIRHVANSSDEADEDSWD